MKKIQFYLIIFLSSFFFSYSVNSAELDIYKKNSLKSKTFKKLNNKVLTFVEFKKVNISSSQLRKI